MQANVHTPERLQGETLAQYRERRKESQRRQNMGRYITFRGNYTNPGRAAVRKLIASCGGVRQFKKQRRAGAFDPVSI